jgi:hypothetical protein
LHLNHADLQEHSWQSAETGTARGNTEEITARVSQPILDALKAFIDSHPEQISRTAAIRMILTYWLDAHRFIDHPNDGGM